MKGNLNNICLEPLTQLSPSFQHIRVLHIPGVSSTAAEVCCQGGGEEVVSNPQCLGSLRAILLEDSRTTSDAC